jgi:hypothetical protein
MPSKRKYVSTKRLERIVINELVPMKKLTKSRAALLAALKRHGVPKRLYTRK